VSPSLPIVSGNQVIRALGRVGFDAVSQAGSHVKLRNPDGRTVIVPLHRDIAPGTLRSILKQADLTVSGFLELL